MTVFQALAHAQDLKPAALSDTRLIAWLSELDGQVAHSLNTFEGATLTPPSYHETAQADQPLLVPPPYDGLYPAYLMAKIDYAMEEYERFNISASVFNSALEAYMRHIARTRMPIQGARFTFKGL